MSRESQRLVLAGRVFGAFQYLSLGDAATVRPAAVVAGSQRQAGALHQVAVLLG